jgi:amino-acid N-acetyltransferase
MIRKAQLSDVPQIAALVNYYARRGELLPRSQEEVYESLREWVVAEENGRILGCGSLLIMWADLAEIRSLAVLREYQGRGLGSGIVEQLLEEARYLGLPKVFALTRQVEFFSRLGFQVTSRAKLPRKFWKDCQRCIRIHVCDEVAMIRPVILGGNGRGKASEMTALATLIAVAEDRRGE